MARTRPMTEKELQGAIIEWANVRGWKAYHTFDSRRSEAGFPDLILLRERDGKRLALELKTEKGKVKPEQTAWLAAFVACGIPAMVVRPADLDYILEVLR